MDGERGRSETASLQEKLLGGERAMGKKKKI